MSTFKSYKKERYTSDTSYRDKPTYGRLCMNCGYPWGKHHSNRTNRCPDINSDFKPWPIDYPTEFYCEELNKNTKVL